MDKELKILFKNAREAREIDFVSPTVGGKCVSVKCEPLNLIDTLT